MARPRVHEDDEVLDAAATIVLTQGARAASIGAIGKASGAPTGSLYHRFGSRDGLLEALWRRAISRFHQLYLEAATSSADPVEAACAMAVSVVAFSEAHPDDAHLLLALRPADLLDGASTLEDLNADIAAAVRRLARKLPVGPERVRMAVVDLPYGAVRRHLTQGALPAGLRDDVAAAARALLQDDQRTAR